MTKANNNFIISLGILFSTSLFLLAVRVLVTDSSRYIFLIWNLALAVVPVLLAFWLVARVRQFGWFRWKQLGLSMVWLVFLPNSFYLLTDFVHLRQTHEANVYFDTILLASFVLNGLVLGYLSVYLVHKELRARLSEANSLGIVSFIFLLCSFAIYLGRFTRWNTWDILLSPAGLLFDVSDRFINPNQHADTYITTLTLFLVLSSLYLVIWRASKVLKK